jgi:hypothetical protein
MRPYRTSLSARLISLSVSTALIGGGVGALTDSWVVLGLALTAAIVCGIAGLVVGIEHYGSTVMALVVALPMLLWAYATSLVVVATKFPSWSYAFIAAGMVPLLMTAFASLGVAEEPAVATAQQATAH